MADSEKTLILTNIRERRSRRPARAVQDHTEKPARPRTRHGTDWLGRTQSGHGASNSAYDETDWHDLGKVRFAGDLSDMLYKHSHTSSYDELVLIAAPEVLSKMRKALRCGTPRIDPCQFARNCDGLSLGMWAATNHSSRALLHK